MVAGVRSGTAPITVRDSAIHDESDRITRDTATISGGRSNMTGNTPTVVLALSAFSYVLMAVIAVATAGLISLLVAGLSALDRRRAPAAVVAAAPPPPAVTDGVDPAVVAAISAAIQATVGAHHIVWIGPTPSAGGWTSEVRQRHHGSHRPHHDH
jgi:hypothetical protein